MVVDDTPNLSRSTSLQIIIENGSTNGRSKRKDKGKGRETDGSVRVKEEPSVAPLLSPEPPTVHSVRCAATYSLPIVSHVFLAHQRRPLFLMSLAGVATRVLRWVPQGVSLVVS